MKILFVATNLPVPPNNGQAIRSLSIIQALESSGHELSFISFANKGGMENLHPLSSFCRSIDLLEREMINLTQQADYLRRIGFLLALRSFSVERFRSVAMREKIQNKLQTTRFDLILSDGIYALTNVPQTKVPIALNCHNIEYAILERYSQLERNPLKQYYAKIESHLMRIAERHRCHRAALALVCSQVDLEILRMLHSDLPVFVVPNVIDTDLIRPVEGSIRQSSNPVLLFQGGMDWYPNRDAVEYFIRMILPRVRTDCPKARFIVAGRNPPAQFIEKFRSDPLIEFTGTVPDMRPYLAAASVVIVPLRLGGGTRIKILEACAAGKPIVSTSIGAEGLNLEAGKEIILADNPAEFARSVINLLQDPARCEVLARSSRSAVVERYSHLTLKQSLDALISNLVPSNNS
jgi:glycosyltransferase involved in cell wall biosynthesis